MIFGIDDWGLVKGIALEIGILIGDWDLGLGFEDLDRGLGLEIRIGDLNKDFGMELEIEIADW